MSDPRCSANLPELAGFQVPSSSVPSFTTPGIDFEIPSFDIGIGMLVELPTLQFQPPSVATTGFSLPSIDIEPPTFRSPQIGIDWIDEDISLPDIPSFSPASISIPGYSIPSIGIEIPEFNYTCPFE